jgi:uncharacterized protein
MGFEWDREKARRNLAKHGVSLEEAATAFWDPLSATVADRHHSFGEQRYRLFGQTVRGRIVVVTHVERGGSIRLISARLATTRERRLYEEG